MNCNWTNALALSVCGIALAAAGYSHAGEKNYSPWRKLPQDSDTSLVSTSGMMIAGGTDEKFKIYRKSDCWNFEANDVYRQNFAAIGYEKGVPMGGNLKAAPGGKTPTFMLFALKDPEGASLDRIQVVKGWLDKQGKTHEKVFNVVMSGQRKIEADGSVKSVGSTVDVANASFTNTIGAAQLAKV